MTMTNQDNPPSADGHSRAVWEYVLDHVEDRTTQDLISTLKSALVALAAEHGNDSVSKFAATALADAAALCQARTHRLVTDQPRKDR